MITLIVNPAAGNGRSKKIAISATERLNKKNIPYRIIETTAPGDATELARQTAASYQNGDYLLAVGGDGTFLEVVQGILGSGMPVAAIPAGTGNDFLKSLHVPGDPMEALEHVLKAEPRAIDVGEINQQVFANECGAGFDVSVLDYAEKAKKHFRGLLPYLWGVLRTLVSYRPIPMVIKADGKEVFNGDCLVFSVANGQYIGGGIHISPTADPQSGKLELIIIKACSRLRMMSYLPGLLGGKILKFKDTVVHCRANRVSVHPTGSPKGFRVNVDGEIRDLPYCEFTVRPSALPVHM
jgi:YegS/Rv2252/BmrU family lipid kinase